MFVLLAFGTVVLVFITHKLFSSTEYCVLPKKTILQPLHFHLAISGRLSARTLVK